MITRLADVPDTVLALNITGELTSDDYRDTLAPALKAHREKYGKVRLLVLLGEEFKGFTAGALWQDEKLLDTNLSTFERVAVVSDSGPIRGTMHLFGWMIPGEVKLFDVAKLDEATSWVSG